ncbi:MAG: hypothetical protein JWN41_1384, partial [Thermoleophilia bacterium]|nr:hypothetical protein [Thermoleophilia bacterium]
MNDTFASQDWVDSLASQLRGDAQVRTECVTWIFGPLVIVVDPDDDHGFAGAAVKVDMFEGDVRRVELVERETAYLSPFVIAGSLARWKSIFGGQLAIIDGVLQSKLVVRGDLPTFTRHRALLDAITR